MKINLHKAYTAKSFEGPFIISFSQNQDFKKYLFYNATIIYNR